MSITLIAGQIWSLAQKSATIKPLRDPSINQHPMLLAYFPNRYSLGDQVSHTPIAQEPIHGCHHQALHLERGQAMICCESLPVENGLAHTTKLFQCGCRKYELGIDPGQS
jgi:hypothetical protein